LEAVLELRQAALQAKGYFTENSRWNFEPLLFHFSSPDAGEKQAALIGRVEM